MYVDALSRDAVIQNLEDAGCPAEFIRKYLEVSDAGAAPLYGCACWRDSERSCWASSMPSSGS